MKRAVFILFALIPMVGLAIWPAKPATDPIGPAPSKTDSIYMALDPLSGTLPSRAVFEHAMKGMEMQKNQTGILSIIDFTIPSTEKRLWIIDLKNAKVLHHTLVAHGRNSGELYAKKFSNTPESNQSSLGFYRTGQTYIGKNGLSLKLYGLEPGVNDRAESRAIVIHSANYVSESFIKKYGRLGRSFGCPAIPVDNHKEIINTLAGGSCLYIHYSSIQ